jgi:hypothetical protein
MSSPSTLPVVPTRFAESRTWMPPPDPRIEHGLASFELNQGGRIATSERDGDGIRRRALSFYFGIEIRRDGTVAAARRGDTADTGLACSLGDRAVFLLDSSLNTGFGHRALLTHACKRM